VSEELVRTVAGRMTEVAEAQKLENKCNAINEVWLKAADQVWNWKQSV